MAQLPDLNTSSLGFVAYYNVLDNTTLTSVDPTATISSNAVKNYTQYDNGIEGETDSRRRGDGREVKFRVKTDGWILLYLDRTYNYGVQQDYTSVNLEGDTHLITDLTDPRSGGGWNIQDPPIGPGSGRAFAELTIEEFATQMASDQNVTISFTVGDVSYYSFNYSTATNVDVIWVYQGGSNTSNLEFSYPSTITRLYDELLGCGQFSSSDGSFEGLTTHTGENYAVVDVQNRGLIPNAGTSYSGSIYRNGCLVFTNFYK